MAAMSELRQAAPSQLRRDLEASERLSSTIARMLKRIEIHEDGCWIWKGIINWNGYGTLSGVNGRTINAHRLVYLLLVGEIPEGLTIDHLCRVRHCVNPAHLEPVTKRENTLRGNTLPAINARKTRCKRGHPFDAENTYVAPDGSRHCKECGRQKVRKHRAVLARLEGTE